MSVIGQNNQSEWNKKQLKVAKAKLDLARSDGRVWVPSFLKRYWIARHERDVFRLEQIVKIEGEIGILQSENAKIADTIQKGQSTIDQNNDTIKEKQKQVREIVMAKRKGAVNRDGSSDMKAGLHSLFMMVVFAIVLVLAIVFFVLSPFGSKKQVERPSPDLNKPTEVIPIVPNDGSTGGSFQFYEVLPERKFESTEANLSEQQQEGVGRELKVDKVEKLQQEEPVADEVIVEETDDTYDEPMPKSEQDIQISASGVQYVLQIKTFDSASEADQRRAEVMMAGVDAQVVRKELETGDFTYTVVSTPFANKETASVAFERLQASGISSMVVEQKLQ